MGNVVATDMADDDEIISKGLMDVREGILNGNWDVVCKGYNSISGEDLQPFQYAKSRLENIREKMQLGKKEPAGVKKNNKKEKPPKTAKDDLENVTVISKEEGKMKIITNEFNQEEADFNEEIDSKTMKLPIPTRKPLTEKLANKDGDFRFRNNNRPPVSI